MLETLPHQAPNPAEQLPQNAVDAQIAGMEDQFSQGSLTGDALEQQLQSVEAELGITPPETDGKGNITAAEEKVAADGTRLAEQQTHGPEHASDEATATERELARVKTAKGTMIKIFGKEKYDERFAGNPNVDPDAYIAKLQAEARLGRHAKVETEENPEQFKATFGITPEEFDALQRADQRKVLSHTYEKPAGDDKGTETPPVDASLPGEPAEGVTTAPRRKMTLSELAAEKTKGPNLHWSEEDAQGPLHRAARQGKLRAGWSEENSAPVLTARPQSLAEQPAKKSRVHARGDGRVLKTPKIDALDLRRDPDAPRPEAPMPTAPEPASDRLLKTPKINALDLRRDPDAPRPVAPDPEVAPRDDIAEVRDAFKLDGADEKGKPEESPEKARKTSRARRVGRAILRNFPLRG
ncbi:MAG TPA: hypothetical protein VF261_00095 [Candidatus Saccharimonadales bacterium]